MLLVHVVISKLNDISHNAVSEVTLYYCQSKVSDVICWSICGMYRVSEDKLIVQSSYLVVSIRPQSSQGHIKNNTCLILCN